MEGKIRKRIGETFENQLKARNKHIAEINNPDIKSVRKESKLNRQLRIQVNEIEIDPVLRHMKKLHENAVAANRMFPSSDIKYTFSYPFLVEFDPQRLRSYITTNDPIINEYWKRRGFLNHEHVQNMIEPDSE